MSQVNAERGRRGRPCAAGWMATVAAATLLPTMVAAGGCATGQDGSSTAYWDPDAADGMDTGSADAGADHGTPDPDDGGFPDPDDGGAPDPDDGGIPDPDGDCTPGETDACLCPDGLHLGVALCEDDGTWGACACEGEGDEGDEGNPGDDDDDDDDAAETGGVGDDDDDDDAVGDTGGDEGGEEMPAEVCYPGADGTYTTCFELHYFGAEPDGYDYPAALGGDPNYRKPIALIDLEAIDETTLLVPNFQLGEIAQTYKGRWAIVQVHAVESLQALRDAVGPIVVNSGYRSPTYNAGVGGATHSRHMYGDGFDLDPVDVGLNTLEGVCTGEGGMLVEYDSHVHCDFRFDDVDEEFFGMAGGGRDPAPPLGFGAELVEEDGTWTAPAWGFDEGTPRRRWIARDEDGVIVATRAGERFVPPAGSVMVEVSVGRVVHLVRER